MGGLCNPQPLGKSSKTLRIAGGIGVRPEYLHEPRQPTAGAAAAEQMNTGLRDPEPKFTLLQGTYQRLFPPVVSTTLDGQRTVRPREAPLLMQLPRNPSSPQTPTIPKSSSPTRPHNTTAQPVCNTAFPLHRTSLSRQPPQDTACLVTLPNKKKTDTRPDHTEPEYQHRQQALSHSALWRRAVIRTYV